MVTHGPKVRLTTAPAKVEIPPSPLSEQEAEEKKRLLSSSDDNNYPDIRKVALSETSWTLEEFCSRADHFWHCFYELVYDEDGAVVGDGTVDHNRLQKALIKSSSSSSSKKKYFATTGDVLLIIELMLRTGKIIEVGFHKYKKR
jgi:hypothetical protein